MITAGEDERTIYNERMVSHYDKRSEAFRLFLEYFASLACSSIKLN